MKLIIAFLLVLTLSAQAETSELRNKKFFVGCRPSPGECVNSCATRRAIWEIDQTKCDPQDHFNRLACYCLIGHDVASATVTRSSKLGTMEHEAR